MISLKILVSLLGLLHSADTQATFNLKAYTPITSSNCAARKTANPDVNLGNNLNDLIIAAYCQVFGSYPASSDFTYWTNRFNSDNKLRRIDLYREIQGRLTCVEGTTGCMGYKYSDPWVDSQIDLGSYTCNRKPEAAKRDVGALLMFNHQCNIPHMDNCNFDRMNNHFNGIKEGSTVYGNTLYDYLNPTWWLNQFKDAKYAGLQFFALNVYGPDILSNPSVLGYINSASSTTGVKVAYFGKKLIFVYMCY